MLLGHCCVNAMYRRQKLTISLTCVMHTQSGKVESNKGSAKQGQDLVPADTKKMGAQCKVVGAPAMSWRGCSVRRRGWQRPAATCAPAANPRRRPWRPVSRPVPSPTAAPVAGVSGVRVRVYSGFMRRQGLHRLALANIILSCSIVNGDACTGKGQGSRQGHSRIYSGSSRAMLPMRMQMGCLTAVAAVGC